MLPQAPRKGGCLLEWCHVPRASLFGLGLQAEGDRLADDEVAFFGALAIHDIARASICVMVKTVLAQAELLCAHRV